MRRGLNKVMIIGTLERDPETRFTPNGRPVANFSVTTPHTWTTADGEQHEESEWFNVVAWGGLAKLCSEQLKREKLVYVEGRLKTRSWEDEQGKRHFRTEIVAREILILDDRSTPIVENIETDENNYTF